jgi:hypothetical protein
MRRREFMIWLTGGVAAWPSLARARSPGTGGKRDLSLTKAQQSEIWRALRKQAGKTQEPAGLNVGEVIPDTMNLLPFDHHLRRKLRAIRPYRYSLLHDRVLVVDPETKKIILIIGP